MYPTLACVLTIFTGQQTLRIFKMAAALYSCAANIVDKVTKKQGTAKSLAINSHFTNKKKLYALVCETLKYRQILEEIFEQTKLLKLEKKLKHNYALVLVYDFLFGQGIQCGGELKQYITKHKSALQSCLARLKVRAKVHRNEDLLPKHALETGCIPRYVRINRLKTSVEDVIQEFTQNGYEQLHQQNVASYVAQSKNSCNKHFMCDEHLPDVLVFPPGTDLHDHPLYVSGHILLQDKASCLPAHVLLPPPGSHVIDACAAPGNKSSHLASLMNNKGKIFAFDTDKKRLTVMHKLMNTAGVNCVTTTNCSFLEVDPSDAKYSNVEYIVVDPSCSGSGIVNRMDKLVGEAQGTSEKKQRLESLAKFQLSVLNHALSFPFVKRVVYSTCSIDQQENEDVVEAALKANSGRFILEDCLPSWTHRGLTVFQGAEKCIRASPSEDCTNGFYVALFVRKDSQMVTKLAHFENVNTSRKRKLESKDVDIEFPSKSTPKLKVTESSPTKTIGGVVSNDGGISLRNKRRKRSKKQKIATSQGYVPTVVLLGNPALNNVKKKRNRKRKNNKKFSVCS